MSQSDELKKRSISLIRDNQAESGAFITSPEFRQYGYCWFRDSSFIAYSMLVNGEPEACKLFLEWGDRVVCAQRGLITNLIEKRRAGEPIRREELLPSRYMPDGSAHADEHPGTQIDGFADWLWCLGEYASLTGDTRGVTGMEESVRLIVRYLEAFWDLPGQDCWEENDEGIHLSTFACVAGGLKRINHLLGEKELNDLAARIVNRALEIAEPAGFIPKSLNDNRPDASTLLFSAVFRILPPESPVLKRTVVAIESELCAGGTGGVRRYGKDTYYGGAEWIYTTALLALHYLRLGKTERAGTLLEWMEARFDKDSMLMEPQVSEICRPEWVSWWEGHWGVLKGPNLWAHAMYLIVHKEMNRHVSGVR